MLSRSVYCLMAVLLWTLAACTVSSQQPGTSQGVKDEQVLRISGSGTALPLVMVLAEAYGREHPEARFQFDSGTNSGGAIQGLLKGTLDLAVANRPLSDAEASQALEYHPFARDAIVLAAHKPNPVDQLTTAQVQDIYGGSLTGWQQLDGPAEAIIVLDRDEDESARKLVFLSLMAGIGVQARTVVLSTAGDMVSALASTPNSIGYSSWGLLRIRRLDNVKVLTLDGVTPSPESLARGTYPWFLTFGVINRSHSSPPLHRFVAFLIGPEGGKILREYGYVEAEY